MLLDVTVFSVKNSDKLLSLSQYTIMISTLKSHQFFFETKYLENFISHNVLYATALEKTCISDIEWSDPSLSGRPCACFEDGCTLLCQKWAAGCQLCHGMYTVKLV